MCGVSRIDRVIFLSLGSENKIQILNHHRTSRLFGSQQIQSDSCVFRVPTYSQTCTSMADCVIDITRRRLASVANHLAPVRSAPTTGGSVVLRHCSVSVNDSYHRIHGEVPSHEPVWRAVANDDDGKEFTDIIYEKAVGEAIAKVSV
ncbi:1,4-dihydroxy-2-naphthoyl-CoA synthase [Sarracenia purpurea var. burkii]